MVVPCKGCLLPMPRGMPHVAALRTRCAVFVADGRAGRAGASVPDGSADDVVPGAGADAGTVPNAGVEPGAEPGAGAAARASDAGAGAVLGVTHPPDAPGETHPPAAPGEPHPPAVPGEQALCSVCLVFTIQMLLHRQN